jgi:hypothetical protein
VTRITFQDGQVVLRDGKVGTEEACCCGDCDLSSGDAAEQPSVSVTTNCNCNAGTLDGNYPYTGGNFVGNYSWSGTTTCDWTGFPSDAPMDISVSSDCIVTVATYQFPFQSLQGSVKASSLTVDENGKIVGTASVPLRDLFDDVQCTATVTFGP